VPLPVRASPQNLRYLRTKRDRMGHDLPGLDEDGGASAGPGTSVVDSAGS
jgi:3,4-dihydroxy 2-butanone 4-phosphate synthase/GTP cyclohydrolase II